MITSDQLRAFIVDELLEDDDADVSEETSLFKDRLLDSLNLLALISFIEENAELSIETSEITLENIDSITLIMSFLSRKLGS